MVPGRNWEFHYSTKISSNTICCNMLKSCIWISSWFAGVSCTKVHNVTENKFIFVHTVQETAANVHKFGQLYKITEHHSRQCYDKGRSRMNCIHILRHKAHMHTKNWTNTIAYTCSACLNTGSWRFQITAFSVRIGMYGHLCSVLYKE